MVSFLAFSVGDVARALGIQDDSDDWMTRSPDDRLHGWCKQLLLADYVTRLPFLVRFISFSRNSSSYLITARAARPSSRISTCPPSSGPHPLPTHLSNPFSSCTSSLISGSLAAFCALSVRLPRRPGADGLKALSVASWFIQTLHVLSE